MKKIQKKARQDNKGGKDVENDEKKINIKEEEQSKLRNKRNLCFLIHYVRSSHNSFLQ